MSRASWIACAVCTHALVGMQPTRRHVPPSAGSCSMHATLPPSWAARIAAVYPAGPPPRTATSTFIRYQSLSVVGLCWRCASIVTESSSSPTPLEAVALVEADRAGVVAVDAERDRLVPLCACAVEQRLEERRSDALPSRVRDDGDRELGCPLVDEPVPAPISGEQPVPGGADREAGVERDHRGVPGAAPRLDVERDRPGPGVLGRALLPVVGVVEHVAQEAQVLRAAAPDDESGLRARSQREGRLLDERDERLEERRAVRAVDRPVVAGQHEVHDRRDVEVAVADDGLVLRPRRPRGSPPAAD